MQSLDDSIQTTANDQSFADKRLEMVTQQMDVVDGLTTPSDKATLYKKVFGDC